MKTIKPLMLLLMGLLLMQASCEPQPADPKPIAEIDKLPPATQTGANTFGCLVNGKAWVTRTSLDATATSQLSDLLSIVAKVQEPNRDNTLRLTLNDINIRESIFDLNSDGSYSRFYNLESNCEYLNLENETAKLVITRFDRASSIVSGIFDIQLKGECGIVAITNGRFDLTLIQ